MILPSKLIFCKMKRLVYLLVLYLCSFSICNAQHWEDVQGGTDEAGLVYSMYEHNGVLIVSGSFDSIGGGTIPSEILGFWDGNGWTPTNVNFYAGGPLDYAVFQNQLYAGGDFDKVNNVDSCKGIARMVNSNWQSLGTGVTSGKVNCLKEYNDTLFVAGTFYEVNDTIMTRGIITWDGNNWNSIGPGVSGGFQDIEDMEVFQGQLYAGGFFGYINGLHAPGICRYNGTAWDSVGTGMNGPVKCLFVDSVNNRLYVGGQFTTAGGVSTPTGVAYWDGNNWFPVGTFPYIPANDLIIHQGIIYNLTTQSGLPNINGDTINYLAWFDGANWNPVPRGLDAGGYEMDIYQGELYVGGVFSHAGDTLVNGISNWIPGSLGIASPTESRFDWKLFPNPTNEYMILELDTEFKGNINLEFNDINGKRALLKEFNADESTQQHFSLSHLANGTYIVNLFQNNRKVDSKTIVISR
jgi:hypothetical protein